MGNCCSSTDKVRWWLKIHNSSEITMRWEPFLYNNVDESRKPLEYFYMEIPPRGSKEFDNEEYFNFDDDLYSLYVNVFPASLSSEDPACSIINGLYTYLGARKIKINYVPGRRVEFDPRDAACTYLRPVTRSLKDSNRN